MLAVEDAIDEADPSPWRALAGFRLNAEPAGAVRLFHDGKSIVAEASEHAPPRSVLVTHDEHVVVFESGDAFAFSLHPPSAEAAEGEGGDGQVRSPMPGKVTVVTVKVGDTVAKGQALLTLEAMKMEYALTAPFDGTVASLAAEVGAQVAEGAVMAVLDRGV
jgi:biotin carboxyl carrier protein